MDKHPLVSVIMSVYNAENYLKLAIESILNQTFSDFEFIIIEDCSTDSSLQIIENYLENDARIILIKKEVNKGKKGFIENLNIGLDKSRGKYIARMDADDISSLDRFEKQINKLENDKDLFVVGSFLEIINEKDELISIKKAPLSNIDIQKSMFKNIALYHPVLMFRNSNIRYRDKMFGCEDYDLFFNLILQNKKMENIPEALLKYRVLNSSISRSDNQFVKWLFVEKSRALYLEKLINGIDSYEKFCPIEFSNLLKLDYENKLEDLYLGANTAIKFGKKIELEIIIKKITRFYPKGSKIEFKLANIMPSNFLKLYSKILRYISK